ncbi:hypothetical protein KDI_45720 [Dictyobacter arantiisoli]|uniref:Uncharacterized protein n=1 Tax=Dictyobacter arantiisoli TaxID=2014874 RepID=A0A5A5TIH6_9CHLR|nr:hypothetical protein KDI_45720 [Dictyobacter arantiisoli]
MLLWLSVWLTIEVRCLDAWNLLLKRDDACSSEQVNTHQFSEKLDYVMGIFVHGWTGHTDE